MEPKERTPRRMVVAHGIVFFYLTRFFIAVFVDLSPSKTLNAYDDVELF